MFTNIFKATSKQEIRIRFFIAFGTLGVILFSIFAIINCIIGDFIPAIIEFSLVFLIIALIYQNLRTKNTFWATTLGLIPILVISLMNFLNGGFEGTGIYLTFGLPLVCLFLAGLKRGTYAVIFYVLSTLVLQLGLKRYFFSSVNYSNFNYLMYLLGFGIVYVMTWFYHTAWSLSDKVAEAEKTLVVEAKDALQTKLQELERVKQDLEVSLKRTQETNDELRKVNSVIIGREIKMAELKEKIKELETTSDQS